MIDYQVMLVQAMDAIERPHLTLLAEMVNAEDDGPMSILRPQDRNWDQLRATAGASRPALVKILADLETAGLVLTETYIIDGGDLGADDGAKESPLGSRRWEASEFGLDLLARFRGIGIRAGQAPQGGVELLPQKRCSVPKATRGHAACTACSAFVPVALVIDPWLHSAIVYELPETRAVPVIRADFTDDAHSPL
jgi:hypothetical protein